MKFKLSKGVLRKLLIGTTIVNYILLVTYLFLIISSLTLGNYVFFILSLPAYILSKSWILIVGLFGFEGLLLIYYWYKNKNTTRIVSQDDEVIQTINENSLNQIDIFEQDLSEFEEVEDIETELEQELIVPNIQAITSSKPIPTLETKSNDIFDEELTIAESEFDKLWEEAIKHVSIANSNNKKKDGESLELRNNESIQTELPKEFVKKSDKEIKKPNKRNTLNINTRAIELNKDKQTTPLVSKKSMIKSEHKELFNEIAINNWIYANIKDRERIGIYKFALDESHYREKDIKYLIENRILYKILVPFYSGSFCIYSIYEGEDKKLINTFLLNYCKKLKINTNQKSISIVDYQELGLDKKILRPDFQFNDEIIGMIWVSNFLIEDEITHTYALSYQKKKELKALQAAAQLHRTNKEKVVLIITDYQESVDLIQKYIKNSGYGEATILAIGEEKFEEKFLEIINTIIAN